jgi:hypothetical protein
MRQVVPTFSFVNVFYATCEVMQSAYTLGYGLDDPVFGFLQGHEAFLFHRMFRPALVPI